MKKSIKKLVVGTMAGALSLMTVGVTSADAAILVGEVSTACSDISVKLYPSDELSTDYPFATCISTNGNVTQWNFKGIGYDIDNVKDQKSWKFAITNNTSTKSKVNYIAIKDDQGNLVAKKDFSSYTNDNYYLKPPAGSGRTYSITTNLPQYDLNYDGSVNLTDAQLANNLALAIKEESMLQVLLGDTNSNGTIDLTDAQTILKKALKIS